MPTPMIAPIPTRPELSTRDLRSFTAESEKKVLIGMARRMPSRVGPDHLTALGVLAMVGAGLSYWFLQVSPYALLAVNLCLFLNWFGDSLDGTVARVRQKQRPRYGFYVDHLADAFGAIFLLTGLAASGLVSPYAALALLTTYLLLQIHIVLKAHATSVFQIAFGGVGGTEARLILFGLNLALFAQPGLAVFATPVAWILAVTLTVLVIADGVRTGRALDREERMLHRSGWLRSPIGLC